ncbi:zinc finger protein 800 [Drosophila bipectinata]|uniref:zinc finger protein 800 n=1 Tax=Drosophila bipectinata TaxID=42026 RepID=UPI001C8AE31B|nr:zinc finger protein 800 [Drosophila bipectinata]
MRKRSSRCNSDTFKEHQMDSNGGDDISLLQRPLRTAHTGFEEARRAYEDGTSEVRQLLSMECSLIYECKVCRNMFRSLANFISHKRVFCCVSARLANGNGYTDLNSTMIIQPGSGPSSQDIENMLRSRSTGCSPVPRPIKGGGGGIRDLSGVIERLRREKAPKQVRRTSPTVLQLESVPTSSQAVYQTVKVQDQHDSIRTELDEVHRMLNPNDTVVGPDGKAMNPVKIERHTGSDSGETGEQSISDETDTGIFCENCNLTFQTHKTLELHIQKHHTSSAFAFQCPACSLTFLQAAAVIRHLSKDHKKPTRRIRMMRNTILKRRVQQGDVQPKGPCRELKRLKMSDDVVGYEPEPLGAGGEKRKIMSLCMYCEKSFERRAALSTHLLNCRAKQEARLAKPIACAKKLKESKSNDSSLDAGDEDPSATMDLPKIEMDAEEPPIEKFENLAEPANSFPSGLHTVSLDKLQIPNESDSASDEASNSEDEPEADAEAPAGPESNPDADNSKVKGKKKRNVPVEKQLRCRCKICHKQFNALGNLRRHISMFHYRARRFGCNLCEYRAFRRYDIVNHLGFTHKIEGDRDKLTEQYVSTHECEYSRDDVDGDIILLDKEEKTSPENEGKSTTKANETKPLVKTYEKRFKRVKTITEPTGGEEGRISPAMEIKEEPVDQERVEPPPQASNKKRRKSRNQISPESGDHHHPEKRPTRKRVKAVNKDFVYDMVSFKPDASGQLNPAAQGVDSMRAKLRRHPPTTTTSGNEENKPKQWEDYITEAKRPLVLGITRRIMLELVSQGRAVSATLPELPAERPQIRPRLVSHTRSDGGQQPAQPVEAPAPETESFIEKIAKRTAAASKDSAVVNNLWNKVNTAIAQQNQNLKEEPGQLPKREVEKEQVAENKPTEVERPKSPPPLPTPSPSPARHCPNEPIPETLATTGMECLDGKGSQAGAPTTFPALPKPPSVLQAAANGTIQLTLDSLLRAALQN